MIKEKEAKNCWEFMKCPKYIKENCEAYKRGLGQRCWQIAENEVKGCNGFNKQYGCSICPWFIKNAGP